MSIFAEDSRDLTTLPAPVDDGDVDGVGGGDVSHVSHVGDDGDYTANTPLASPVKHKPTALGGTSLAHGTVDDSGRPLNSSVSSGGDTDQQHNARPHTAPAQVHDSYLATRSDVFASTSFVPGKPLVRIKLPKYRKFQGERKLKIRGGLKMISLRGKEKLLTEPV